MKTQTTGVTVLVKRRLVTILLILGAVGGASAPFVHIFYPKTAKEKIQLEENFNDGKVSLEEYKIQRVALKEKYKYFGFTNKRRFLFAIGLPIALFIISIFTLIGLKYIENRKVKLGISISATASLFTASYFIAWNLWAISKGSDFPREWYYATLVIIGILSTIGTRTIVNGWYYEISKINRLKDFVIEFYVEIKEVHLRRPLLTILGKDSFTEAEKQSAKEDAFEADKRILDNAKKVDQW